eukprot:11177804-Lingulodinium_polyedra.AAC.1
MRLLHGSVQCHKEDGPGGGGQGPEYLVVLVLAARTLVKLGPGMDTWRRSQQRRPWACCWGYAIVRGHVDIFARVARSPIC